MKKPKLNAHFIGGIPVDDAETAFRRLGEDMGNYIKYIPDGETGRRRRGISFVKDTLVANDCLSICDMLSAVSFSATQL